MLDPALLDAFRSRFELQGMSIAQLPESIEESLIEAGASISESLIQGHRLFALGFDDAKQTASILIEELANSSGIDRPALPGLLLSNENIDILQRQIQSLANEGDCLIILESSNKDNSEAIYKFSELALSMNLQVLTISPVMQENLSQVRVNSINLKSVSRMDYHCSLTTVSMTLVALIDHHLFQQPI